AYLRALCVGHLINECKTVFLSQEEEILCGEFNQSLTDAIPQAGALKKTIDLSVKKIYQSNEAMVKEIKGYQALHTLLQRAITADENRCEQKNTHIDNLSLRM